MGDQQRTSRAEVPEVSSGSGANILLALLYIFYDASESELIKRN